MTTAELLLDPTGMDEQADDATLAPRPTTLRGLTVGLLDNTKPNTTMFLAKVGALLHDAEGVAGTKLYTKDYFGTPAGDDLLARIVDEVDVVVTGVGDCGSCSAATVVDGILLERAGVPTVSIVSDAFHPSGRAMAAVQGFPGFEFHAVPHPFASLDDAQLGEHAASTLPVAVRILTGGDAE